MANVVLCFTGFRGTGFRGSEFKVTGYRVKGELVNLIDLVHHMGGQTRYHISKGSKVTHLVANFTSGNLRD